MELNRRKMLVLGTAGAAVTAFGALPAFASATEDAIAKFTGGADVGEGGVELTAPEIAENGNTVPIEVSAPGAVAIAIFADGNPTPPVATFKFGPLAASQFAATRIRLAGTQDVIAVAEMEDGSFKQASANIKVTIGGCGG
ncbi:MULTISPECIES: thiosulfate oxidation carrier protein SoxY [unclassified Roseovarius]|uniref:thiosulfate oxidation carrier protein SoxY n=1 Tax=unclassified Roseovarius TaxID=2614913 RepID=UPI00273FCB71|nr:thiosulfate oxidation carrier protein SoxY [Roseovarius sp. MMSF_3350]